MPHFHPRHGWPVKWIPAFPAIAAVIECGVKQTLGYMAQCGAEEGHLVVMDRRGEARRRSEERRHGDGEADGSERRSEGEGARSERRHDGRKVVVWKL